MLLALYKQIIRSSFLFLRTVALYDSVILLALILAYQHHKLRVRERVQLPAQRFDQSFSFFFFQL